MPAFIIRAYGIYIDDSNRLLVSDEIIKGNRVTKFPGGGLEYGEGLIECLKREMLEETGMDFNIVSHFYTTDFFVESAFHSGKQVISVYYKMKPIGAINFEISEEKFKFKINEEGSQMFRFISLDELNLDEFNFPIDRVVVEMLLAR